MPALQYARGAYKRADLPELVVRNQYIEATPANPGDPTVLLARPALVARTVVGDGPIRAVYSAPNVLGGEVFTVSGGNLFRGAIAIGAISGTARVSMASTLTAVMVANDAALYVSDGVTTPAVAFPDGAGVSSVAYLGGYSLAARAETRRIYFTLDPTTWDGLDYVSAEQDTGSIVGIAIVSDQLWVFCERVVEVFTLTGNADAPIQRIEGRLYDKGCLQRDTIAKADNSVTWVGSDRIVYRGDSAPVRISNHGIEELLNGSLADDLRAWAFPWNGHTFYVLSGADWTRCYDYATGEWCEFSSYGRSAWRAHLGVFRDGVIIAGDDENGTLWGLADGPLTDDGSDPGTIIDRGFTALMKSGGVFIDNVQLDCSTGRSPEYTDTALIEMRISRDGGETWGQWREKDLGNRGNYRARAVWRRCGLHDGVTVFEFRVTDKTTWRLSGVSANDSLAGRSR